MLKVGHLYRAGNGSRLFIDNLIIRIDHVDEWIIRYTYIHLNEFTSSCSNSPRLVEFLTPLSSLEMELL